MLTCARCPRDVPDPRALVNHLATEHLLDPKRAEAEALVRVFKPGDRVRPKRHTIEIVSPEERRLPLGGIPLG